MLHKRQQRIASAKHGSQPLSPLQVKRLNSNYPRQEAEKCPRVENGLLNSYSSIQTKEYVFKQGEVLGEDFTSKLNNLHENCGVHPSA